MPEWVNVDLHEIERIVWNIGNTLHDVGPIPEPFLNGVQNPHEVDAFDPNRLLEVFDRIKMAPGYVLDYIYAFDGHGGEPFLYSRGMDEPPLESLDEYCDRYKWERPDMLLGAEPTPESTRPYLQHLAFTTDVAGYHQFAVFIMVARRFYLAWHSNYNTRTYITYRPRLNRVVSECAGWMMDEDRAALETVDPTPAVAIEDDVGTVRLLNYEVNRGFSFLNVRIRPPNELIQLEDEVVVRSGVVRLY